MNNLHGELTQLIILQSKQLEIPVIALGFRLIDHTVDNRIFKRCFLEFLREFHAITCLHEMHSTKLAIDIKHKVSRGRNELVNEILFVIISFNLYSEFFFIRRR